MPEVSAELLRLYGKMVDNQADQITLAGEQVRVISELNTKIETLNNHLSNGIFKQVKDCTEEQNKETRRKMNSIYVVLIGLLVPLILAILNYAAHLKQLKEAIGG